MRLFIFLLISTLEVKSNLLGIEYAQLISSVHSVYDTSSVLIIHNDQIESEYLHYLYKIKNKKNKKFTFRKNNRNQLSKRNLKIQLN